MRYILILMMLVATPALACSSYEECMNHYKGNIRWMESNLDYQNLFIFRAIAIKLDEISQKLNKPDRWIYGKNFIDTDKCGEPPWLYQNGEIVCGEDK